MVVELSGSNALAVPLQKSPLSFLGSQAGCRDPPVTCQGFSKGLEQKPAMSLEQTKALMEDGSEGKGV